jgi:hypothetical protein
MGLLNDAAEKIRSINRTYAVPRIKMTRGTKLILIALRLYLIALVGMLLYSLITTVR